MGRKGLGPHRSHPTVTQNHILPFGHAVRFITLVLLLVMISAIAAAVGDC